jgi:tRNA threonylcarbamoyladenosine biosynthesis protein TsaB
MSQGVAAPPAGWFVALDTSGSLGSVALAHGPNVVARRLLERRADHAARLVPAIAEVLVECGIARGDLGGVVVGEGPGSFTGVRIAAATAKGLTHALRVPLWAISSLAAVALAADGPTIRYAIFDARQDRVYGACYGVASAGVQTLVRPHAAGLGDLLAGEIPTGAVFVGDGAERHRGRIEGAGFAVADADLSVSPAEGLVRYLALAPDYAPVGSVAEWEPRYIREWRVGPTWTS